MQCIFQQIDLIPQMILPSIDTSFLSLDEKRMTRYRHYPGNFPVSNDFLVLRTHTHPNVYCSVWKCIENLGPNVGRNRSSLFPSKDYLRCSSRLTNRFGKRHAKQRFRYYTDPAQQIDKKIVLRLVDR